MSTQVDRLETPPEITAILDEFEKGGYFEDYELAGQFAVASEKIDSSRESEKKAALAERWAFQFYPQTPGEVSCWKTHFGPASDWGNAKVPDIAWLDPSIFAYWTDRMSKARHPLLRARYADLVWDLSKVACNLKPSIDAARVAIDGYIESGPLADAERAIPVSTMLQRALKVALGIKDQSRADLVSIALFDLISRVDEMWGWVTLFDIFEEQQKVQLSAQQREAVIAAFEACIAAMIVKPEGEEPGSAFNVAGRLVRHYQRLGQRSEVERVVRATGQAAERRAVTANHTVAHLWLDQVFRFYRINELDSEAERVQLLARQRGDLAQRESHLVEVNVDVPADELEEFMDGITEGGLEQALRSIVGEFIPDLKEIRERSQRLSEEFPLASMVPIAKVSEGQIVGNVGTIDSDPDGSLLHAVSEYIGYSMYFLARAFDRAWERYEVTPEQIVSLLYESPLFTVRFRGIIKLGIEAHIAGDYPKSIHLLVPQIENALRFLLHLVGRPPNKARRGDPSSMTEKSLTDILEHEPVIEQYLGKDAHLYLLAFLTDSRGRNIRNRMSHGLMAAEEFNRGISDRVMHILLMLGTLRRREPSAEPTEAGYEVWGR